MIKLSTHKINLNVDTKFTIESSKVEEKWQLARENPIF